MVPRSAVGAPGVDDGCAVDVVDGGHDAVLEFLLGGDADVAEDELPAEVGEVAVRAVLLDQSGRSQPPE